jgi:TRAP-type mannitol/chloroaromatic compound transport system substrate-binding protein
MPLPSTGKRNTRQRPATVPFGLNAQEMAAWLYYGGGQALWDELYAPFNLKPFAAGSTGAQMGGWFDKDISTVKELEGLKMRMPGLGGDVLATLGAHVINLPGGEIQQPSKPAASMRQSGLAPTTI